ncbi:MAG: hypothetical protein HC884_03590 [Chloroflexaceae bacterium]|nr:hypothetical protein [Chloroflexaceae bacterium]
MGLALHWHWLYILVALPVGLVVGSFYPGVGLALLFAAGTGDASLRDRRVRVIHGGLFWWGRWPERWWGGGGGGSGC